MILIKKVNDSDPVYVKLKIYLDEFDRIRKLLIKELNRMKGGTEIKYGASYEKEKSG